MILLLAITTAEHLHYRLVLRLQHLLLLFLLMMRWRRLVVHASHLVPFPDLLTGLAAIRSDEVRLRRLLLLVKVLKLLLCVHALVFFTDQSSVLIMTSLVVEIRCRNLVLHTHRHLKVGDLIL